MEQLCGATKPCASTTTTRCENLLPSTIPRRATHAACSLPPQTRRRDTRTRAIDPSMQDVLMGGAVLVTGAAALVGGSKEEAEICESCAGRGGVRCFACEGSGKMSGVAIEELTKAAAAPRDPLGRSVSKRECRACRGTGMLFCKKCSGSGYVSK